MKAIYINIFVAIAAVLFAGPLHATDSDAELVRRLTESQKRDEIAAVIDDIDARLTTAPLDSEYTDEMVRLFVSRIALRGYMSALPRLAGDGDFSSAALDTIAISLVSGQNYPQQAGWTLSQVLIYSYGRLSAESFEQLMSATRPEPDFNPSFAIDVLAVTKPTDPRYGDVIDGLCTLLAGSEHLNFRNYAIEALVKMGSGAALPPTAIDALVHTAISDPYVLLRVEALEGLAQQTLTASEIDVLTASFANELISPSAVWQKSTTISKASSFRNRILVVLTGFHETPYPAAVVDALVQQSLQFDYEYSLDVLQGAFDRGEVSVEQHQSLIDGAYRVSQPQQTREIYEVAYSNATSADVVDAIFYFNGSSNDKLRRPAGHLLLSYYGDSPVPDEVAENASSILKAHTDTESRVVAVKLLLGSEVEPKLVHERISVSLERFPDDFRYCGRVLETLSVAHVEKLVQRVARMSGFPERCAYTVLNRFGTLAVRNDEIAPETAEALQKIARTHDSNLVVQAAGAAMTALGLRSPSRVAIKNRDNQGTALGILFLLMLVTDLIAGVMGLIAVLGLPPLVLPDGTRAVGRAGKIIGWIVFSFVISILLLIGFVGFIGHNSAPTPSYTLMFNIPAIIGSAFYVILARVWWRRYRQKGSSSPAAIPQPSA